MQRVVFTGGECFLLGRELDGLVAHANELALETRVITNGYWAINTAAARKRVAALASAGLSEMMLSTGSFHQRFVPVERIVHAARAAAGAGIPVRIAIEVCDQQTFDETLLLEQLAGEIYAREVFLGHDPWTEDAAGRGETPLSHNGLMARGGDDRVNGRCSQLLDTITVTPDQQLLACCGFPMEHLPRLRVGSIEQHALDDVLRSAPNELLKMWLHVAGPKAIGEFVAAFVPDFALPPAVSICQSCVALQRDPRAMAAVAEHGGEMVQAVADAFIRVNGGIAALQAF